MHVYTHLIKENIAPVGAKNFGVYDKLGTQICTIPLGKLKQPEEQKLYNFLAISDVHVQYETASDDLSKALTYAEANCDFTCICGDLTDTAAIESQLAEYKNIINTYAKTKPVYAIAGNHENYNGYSDKYLEKYTGQPLYYSFTKGEDVFIMMGHYGAYAGDGIGWLPSEFISLEELQWLYETLEANRNKRCFIFNHVFPTEHEVGNPTNFYKSVLAWKTTDNYIGQAYINLLKHYKNAILFHGHTHSKLELQELAKTANYSNKYGYKSIHIPSLAAPRDIIDGTSTNMFAESEGYIIDVYENKIVLRGRNFVKNEDIPLGTYCLDTTLVNIEAGTFIDDTDTIKLIN